MKETGFITQNKEKWVNFEKHMLKGKKDPDKLSSEFIQLTDDLSYSRTFYPNRSVRVYLNNVAQKVFHSIYRGKARRFQKFREFWKEELPRLVYDSRKSLTTALIIFILSFAIGWLSSAFNPEFPRQILGDAYIEMTKANIETGDPMKVYKESREIDMLIGITLNNLMVAALAFVMGVLFSIGSVGVIMFNGIMVGCFQYFFYERGLFMESFLTIWLHGTLEISAIVIAGGAGLTLGSGIVFPGTYTRGQAFRIGAMRGMKIMIGIMPIICFAAIIESFITRYTDVPDPVKALLILVSAVFVVGYFILLPYWKARRGFRKELTEVKLPPTPDDEIPTNRVRDTGELFKDSFSLFRRMAGKIAPAAIILSLIYAVTYSLLRADTTGYSFSLQASDVRLIDNAFNYFSDISGYFEYERHPWMWPGNLLFFSIISFLTYFYYRRIVGEPDLRMSFSYFFLHFWKSLFIGGMITGLFFLPMEGAGWLVVLFMPLFLAWLTILHKEDANPFTSLAKTFDYVFASFGRTYGLFLILMLVTFLSMAVISAPQIVWFVFEVLYWFIDIEGEVYWHVFVAFFTLVTFVALAIVMPLFLSAFGVLFFTLREIRQADALLNRVESIGRPKPKKPVMHATIILCLVSLLTTANPASTQNNAEAMQNAIDSAMAAAESEVPEESAYYNEYYQDENYYEQLRKKREQHERYSKQKLDKQTLSEEEWKKATSGMDYSEEKQKKKARELEEDDPFTISQSDGLFATGIARTLLFVLGALIIGLVFYLIIRNTLWRRNTGVGKKQVTTLEEAAENIHESDLERFLRESLETMDYRTAVRVYYLILIRELSDRDMIRWKKDKTNREYLVEMRRQPHYEPFASLTRVFEYVWYGDAMLENEDFRKIQPSFTGFIETIRKIQAA
ncbi:MAG: stage II sporulation protein M [Bacteroidia bacterium]|nr:stage II sporulation protein M [Bacteroidia bacterium]